MKKVLLSAICAWSIVAFSGYAEASCVVEESVTVQPEGKAIREDRCDSAKNRNVTIGTLLSGEDQANNLLMTSGGKVRSTTMASAVTTNTTSAPVALPIGTKRIYGSVDGTGAVTQTQTIYGGITSGVTASTGELLCTITLSGTTHAHDGCTVTTAHLFYIVTTTATTGTAATGVITAMY